MTARPARVRMRSRNPWVFARRRLFGWYVRLLTASLQGTSWKVAHLAYKNFSGRNAWVGFLFDHTVGRSPGGLTPTVTRWATSPAQKSVRASLRPLPHSVIHGGCGHSSARTQYRLPQSARCPHTATTGWAFPSLPNLWIASELNGQPVRGYCRCPHAVPRQGTTLSPTKHRG